MWVNFNLLLVLYYLLGFYSRFSVFPPSTKTNISKFISTKKDLHENQLIRLTWLPLNIALLFTKCTTVKNKLFTPTIHSLIADLKPCTWALILLILITWLTKFCRKQGTTDINGWLVHLIITPSDQKDALSTLMAWILTVERKRHFSVDELTQALLKIFDLRVNCVYHLW